jgi:hypothetical protein
VSLGATREERALAAEPAGCGDDPKLALLDFWLGEWTVTHEATTLGSNRIERTLDGCAILEHWTSARGGRGLSLFYVGPAGEALKQVWITTDARGPGGTKEKSLLTRAADGTLVFQGLWWHEDGREILDRTRLTPLPDGRVRQVIEVSADAGSHWTTTFDAIYTPAGGD